MISGLIVLLFGFGFSPVVITAAPALVPLLVPAGGALWFGVSRPSSPTLHIDAVEAVEMPDPTAVEITP